MLGDNIKLLKEIVNEMISEEKEDKTEIKLELINKDKEMDKVNLERDLNKTGKKKSDFLKEVIDKINDIIQDKATIDEIITLIKKRKKKEIKDDIHFIKF